MAEITEDFSEQRGLSLFKVLVLVKGDGSGVDSYEPSSQVSERLNESVDKRVKLSIISLFFSSEDSREC
jgi:hypothetical protein